MGSEAFPEFATVNKCSFYFNSDQVQAVKFDQVKFLNVVNKEDNLEIRVVVTR